MTCGGNSHSNPHGGLVYEWGCASEAANVSEDLFPQCRQMEARHPSFHKHRHMPHSRLSAASLLGFCTGKGDAGETRQRQSDARALYASGRQELHLAEAFSSNTHKRERFFCLGTRAPSRKTPFVRASTSAAGESLPLLRRENERTRTETPQASFAELQSLSPSQRAAQLVCLDQEDEVSEDEELQRLTKTLQQQGFPVRAGSSKENNGHQTRLKKTSPQQRRDGEKNSKLRQSHQEEETSSSAERENPWDVESSKDTRTPFLLQEAKGGHHRKQKTDKSSRKKGERSNDVIDQIEAWSLQDHQEDREERLRMEGRDLGSLLEVAKKQKKQEASSDFVPEVYVQSACLAVKPGTCSGCGAVLQCFDPRKPGYLSPSLLGRGGGMTGGSGLPSASAAAFVTERAAARDATATTGGGRSGPRRENAGEEKEKHPLRSQVLKACTGVLSCDGSVSGDPVISSAAKSYGRNAAAEAAAGSDASAGRERRLGVAADNREGEGLHHAGAVASAFREERFAAGMAGEKKKKRSMYDLSAPAQATRAFEAAGRDPEKVAAMAAEAEGVDFHVFAAAMANALGVPEEEVAEKLSFACNYNGEGEEVEAEEEEDEQEQEQEETQDALLPDGETSERIEDVVCRTKKDVDAGDGRIDTRDGDTDTTVRETDTRSTVNAEHIEERGDVTMQEDIACLKTVFSATAAAGNAPEANKTLESEQQQVLLQQSSLLQRHRQLICQRCHAIKGGKKFDESLRAGFCSNSLLHPDTFRKLVASLRSKRCIFLLLVDLISPEVLPALPSLVRVNPLFVGVTKCDLLPGALRRADRPGGSPASATAAENFQKRCVPHSGTVKRFVYDLLMKHGGSSLKTLNPRNIFLLSNRSGAGLTRLINALGKEAIRRKRTVYVIGAANAGKTSFLNKLLSKASDTEATMPRYKPKAKGETEANAAACAVPGTTLGFLPVVINQKWKIVDTPGIFLRGSYSNLLSQEELQVALPSSSLHRISLNIKENEGVWLGALARLELLKGRGCFASLFFSVSLPVYPVRSIVLQNEVLLEAQRRRLSPPSSLHRLEPLKPLIPQDFEVHGAGWRHTAADIVLSGLGWISITGCGPLRVRLWIPEEVLAYQRAPLVPQATRACPPVPSRALELMTRRTMRPSHSTAPVHDDTGNSFDARRHRANTV